MCSRRPAGLGKSYKTDSDRCHCLSDVLLIGFFRFNMIKAETGQDIGILDGRLKFA
jgi:hypothetical protein